LVTTVTLASATCLQPADEVPDLSPAAIEPPDEQPATTTAHKTTAATRSRAEVAERNVEAARSITIAQRTQW
jgi:hypothetical protein